MEEEKKGGCGSVPRDSGDPQPFAISLGGGLHEVTLIRRSRHRRRRWRCALGSAGRQPPRVRGGGVVCAAAASAPRVRRRAQMRAAIGTQAEGGRAAAAANIIAIDPAARAVLPNRAEPSRVSRAELSRAGSSPRHAELSRRVAPPSRAAEPRRQQQQSRTHKQNP